jgi:hypothetical protein
MEAATWPGRAISVSTLRQDVAAGHLVPTAVTERGTRLFDRSAVEAYLARRAERRRPAGSGAAV